MELIEKKIMDFIDNELPRKGKWYSLSNKKPFIDIALHLLYNGQQSEDYIKDLLGSLYASIILEIYQSIIQEGKAE